MDNIESSSGKKYMYLFLIITLLISNVYFFIRYSSAKKSLGIITVGDEIFREGKRALRFMDLMVNLLLSGKVVTDDERIRLENAVRDIGDEAILAKWKAFTESDTEALAQKKLLELLTALIEKVDLSTN